jgi:hypothetical protein
MKPAHSRVVLILKSSRMWSISSVSSVVRCPLTARADKFCALASSTQPNPNPARLFCFNDSARLDEREEMMRFGIYPSERICE